MAAGEIIWKERRVGKWCRKKEGRGSRWEGKKGFWLPQAKMLVSDLHLQCRKPFSKSKGNYQLQRGGKRRETTRGKILIINLWEKRKKPFYQQRTAKKSFNKERRNRSTKKDEIVEQTTTKSLNKQERTGWKKNQQWSHRVSSVFGYHWVCALVHLVVTMTICDQRTICWIEMNIDQIPWNQKIHFWWHDNETTRVPRKNDCSIIVFKHETVAAVAQCSQPLHLTCLSCCLRSSKESGFADQYYQQNYLWLFIRQFCC